MRNEASLLLVIAAIVSGAAIAILSGFLEPSQPPAVAAIQIGDPRDNVAPAQAPESKDRKQGRDRVRPRPARSSTPERPAQLAPPARADDPVEDDGELD